MKYVVVDLETTGNAPKKGDGIIQIAAVIVEDKKIKDSFVSFVKPQKAIPPFIEELTGINERLVENAPSFNEIAEDLLRFMDGCVFVAHNVSFDLNFLQGELTNAGFPLFVGSAIDTVELSKIMLPTADSYKLVELTDQSNVEHAQPHRADSDAYATAELLISFQQQAEQLPMITLEKLSQLGTQLKSNISLFFNQAMECLKGKLVNLPENIEVHRGIAYKKLESASAIDVFDYVDFPASDEQKSALLQKLAHYEHRAGQFRMMDQVYAAFTNDKHAAIEAGTGIGKTLAYLIPAAYYAKKENKPVLVTTKTLSLQDQLLNKEMKYLQELLPFELTVSMLKGKHHYLDLFKFEQSLLETSDVYDVNLTKMQILIWLLSTTTGDVDELHLTSGGHLFWNRMRQDDTHIERKKNYWAHKDFFQQAKERADISDIVVTNHAMLFSDIERKQPLFSNYEYIIIDEAHQLEASARHHLGTKLVYNREKRFIGQLSHSDKTHLLENLEQLVGEKQIEVSFDYVSLHFSLQELLFDLDELFSMWAQYVSKNTKQHVQSKVSYRIKSDWQQTKLGKAIVEIAKRMLTDTKEVSNGIQERLDKLSSKSDKLTNAETAFVEEMYSYLLEWKQLSTTIQHTMITPLPDYVLWLEGDKRSLPNSLRIHAQPVFVKTLLRNHLFQQKKSIIMTSATLTVDGSFYYFLSNLGMKQNASIITDSIVSPFSYKDHAKLYISEDIPDIKQVSIETYSEAISSQIVSLAKATKGRMLILFTSYELLRLAYNELKNSAKLEEFLLLAQGVSPGSSNRLLKNFQQFDKSILLGTNAFWEGVDIPGDSLSCLVIVRLPFTAPNEPIMEAKNEYLKAIGKNPFSELSLPEAIIRFKQGFGRLIRSHTDKGVLIIFDKRISESSYGSKFIQSLPNVPVEKVNMNKIVEDISDWL